jgi:hypothetical protein
MNLQTPEFAAVLARLDRLEKSNRRYRALALTAPVLVVIAFLMAAALQKTQDRLVTKNLQLVDEAGKVRADLMMSPKFMQPALVFYDQNQKEPATIRLTNEGPQFLCFDKAGKFAPLQVGLTDKGPFVDMVDKASPNSRVEVNQRGVITKGVELSDNNGKRRAHFRVTEDEEQQPYLNFLDKSGRAQLALGSTTDSKQPYVVFSDGSGKQRITLALMNPEPEVDVARISCMDANGVVRVAMATDSKQGPWISVADDQSTTRVGLRYDQNAGPIIFCNNRANKTRLSLGADNNGGFLNLIDSQDRIFFRQPRAQ